MKNLFKKISALVLAAIMVLSMCTAVFAKEVSSTDTATVTIKGLNTDQEPKVTLYKVVEGNYSEKGFLGTYTKATNVVIKDLDNPTQAEINTIAQRIKASDATKITPFATISATVSGEQATATVSGAGVYIALITGASKTIYNPVYIGVSYNESSVLSHDKISAGDLYAGTKIVKKTSPQMPKEITGGTTPDNSLGEGDENKKDTVSVGDVISYKLTPTAPSYPTNATNKTFYVSDTMTAGLDFDFSSLKLSADDTEVTRSDANGVATYRIGETVVATAKQVGNGFNMSFSYDGFDSLNSDDAKGTMPRLAVTYKAVVNDKAVVGGTGNKNDAYYFFANDPNNGNTYEKLDEKPGTADGVDKVTNSKTVYSYQIALKKVDSKKNSDGTEKLLTGAVFGIYSDKECKNLVDEMTTNEKGLAVSTALAKGTYYVKELVAPTGYSLSDKVYEVEAKWTSATTTIDGNVTRTSYTTDPKDTDGKQVGWILNNKFYKNKPSEDAKPAYVKSTNTTTSTSVTTSTNGAGTVATLVNTTVPNTQMSQLPSTGGMGTYLFTIVGVVLMTCAAGAFFVSRRKTNK